MELLNPLSEVQPEDLMKYGMIPEFVGRIPVVCALEPLRKEDLVRILIEPRNSLVKQYQSLLKMEEWSWFLPKRHCASLPKKLWSKVQEPEGYVLLWKS